MLSEVAAVVRIAEASRQFLATATLVKGLWIVSNSESNRPPSEDETC